MLSFTEQFISLLRDTYHVDPAQLTQLQQESEEKGEDIVDVAARMNILPEEDLARSVGDLLHVPFVDVSATKIPHEIIVIIPEEAAEHYQMLAYKKTDEELSIAFVDPRNIKAQEAAAFIAKERGLRPAYFITSKRAFATAIRGYQALGKEAEEVLGIAKERFVPEKKEEKVTAETFEEVVRTAPVSKMVALIMQHAVNEGASDIHVEPEGDTTKIRFRVDGVLRIALRLPLYVHSAIISRIKVLAKLKLDETRLPQDGRIKMNVAGKDIDFRVSIFPLIDYEKVVLRILESSDKVPTLEELGFTGRAIEVLWRNIKRPNGLFLITGPTGSGKTTTLYVVLSMLDKVKNNITTLEDPVEYFIPGVNQAQVRSEIGFTFAAGLRSILRQDPNIIMVGEIRDTETAELAVHAGLTGHLVFSTLHTRNAVGSLPRLIDMKLQPYLLAATLNIIMAQRLVRKICESCRTPVSIPPTTMKEIKAEIDPVPEIVFQSILPRKITEYQFFYGKGCARCAKTGYQGRTVITEMIEMTEKLRDLVPQNLPQKELKEELERQHFVTMKQDGLLKALAGITTVEEVMRATRE